MARVKQFRIIGDLINSIEKVTLSDRCSLSEKDLIFLQEALSDLRILQRKKGKTYEEVLQLTSVIVEKIVYLLIEIPN